MRSTAAACALCLGAVAPVVIAGGAGQAAADVVAAGDYSSFEQGLGDAIREVRTEDGNTADYFGASGDWSDKDWAQAVNGASVVVVTPGTDDGSLYPRINGIVGERRTLLVSYPESFGPLVGGRSDRFFLFSEQYDDSKQVAIDHNLEVMQAFSTHPENPFVVYTGYSQGADALGDAAEQAHQAGTIDESNSLILLVSDPRSPWGLKSWGQRIPGTQVLFTALGAESNGARDPGKTGDELEVASIIVVGDPVANWQWIWYRPVSSLLVDAAGFITIHAGNGVQNYGNIGEDGGPTHVNTLYSEDGNTTYEVYDAYHPLALLVLWAYSELGIDYSEEDAQKLDAAAEAFYPMQAPSVASADPVAPVTTVDPRPAAGSENRATDAASLPAGVERSLNGGDQTVVEPLDVDPEPQPDPEPQAESETLPASQPDPEPQPEPQPEPEPQPQPEAENPPAAEPQSEPQQGSQGDAPIEGAANQSGGGAASSSVGGASDGAAGASAGAAEGAA